MPKSIQDIAYIFATSQLMAGEFNYEEFQKINCTDYAWQPFEYMPESEYAELVSGLAESVTRLLEEHSKSTIRERARAILKEYKDNEKNNHHTANLLLLAENFGKPIEIQECQRRLQAINNEQEYNILGWMKSQINAYYHTLTTLAR